MCLVIGNLESYAVLVGFRVSESHKSDKVAYRYSFHLGSTEHIRERGRKRSSDDPPSYITK